MVLVALGDAEDAKAAATPPPAGEGRSESLYVRYARDGGFDDDASSVRRGLLTALDGNGTGSGWELLESDETKTPGS